MDALTFPECRGRDIDKWACIGDTEAGDPGGHSLSANRRDDLSKNVFSDGFEVKYTLCMNKFWTYLVLTIEDVCENWEKQIKTT